ncbi:YaiI/YqxD family protein [Dehalobacter sp. TBBPA1]|uniref:YaiI/YqxD family protein n=1 Tax=Dehalobacter sp. TBBPA1 TaxID=3235037 RepID=UPI0034A465B6
MKILVDGDACPVKELIVSCAKQFELPVIMIIDTSHELKDDYSMVITVDQDRDSVDFALMKRLDREDIVVTQDYGLAALVLGKGARAINQNGLIYTDSNIERLLFERHVGQKVRRGGGRTTHVKKRTKEDNERFRTAFIRLIEETKDRTFE